MVHAAGRCSNNNMEALKMLAQQAKLEALPEPECEAVKFLMPLVGVGERVLFVDVPLFA